MPRSLRNLRLLLLLTGNLFLVRAVAGQDSEPIARFAFDVRAAYAQYQDRPDLEARGIPISSFGLGIDVGAHVYPLRWNAVALGIGGQFMTSHATQAAAAGNAFTLGSAETTFRTVAPQISVNFGHRQGWSYISGGIGTSRYDILEGKTPVANNPGLSLKTVNYGVGARWFWGDHLAFCLDIRWYAIGQNPGRDGTRRMTRLVVSSGLSLH